MTWVDRLVLEPITEVKQEPTDPTISLISWNILAEAYATPRSHPNLPDPYAHTTFHSHLRRPLILDTLRRLLFFKDDIPTVDVLCLQEVDSILFHTLLVPFFESYDYLHVYAPRATTTLHASQAKAAPDGCATFYSSRKWKCIGSKIVRFDDLANPHRPPLHPHSTKTTTITPQSTAIGRSALMGISSSYQRRNAALLVHLVSTADVDTTTAACPSNSVIIANTHLYWHPGYEYIKLSQSYYLLHCVQQFTQDQQQQKARHGDAAILVCGDFNSKPQSIVYQFITQGCVDATVLAPWNHTSPLYDYYEEEEGEIHESVDPIVLQQDSSASEWNEMQDPIPCIEEESVHLDSSSTGIENKTESSSLDDGLDFSSLYIHEAPLNSNALVPRYMLDFTLNKLTRWLRILGIDAALETEEEERARTKDGNMYVFLLVTVFGLFASGCINSHYLYPFFFFNVGPFLKNVVKNEEI